MGVVLDKGRFGPWALVTGASSGIGKEFARQIAASGINIVLVARREALLREVGVEFSRRYGVEHRAVALDVSREDFLGQLASATDDLDIGLVDSADQYDGASGRHPPFRRETRRAEAGRPGPRGGDGCGKRRSADGERRSREGVCTQPRRGASLRVQTPRCLRHCTGGRVYGNCGARKVRLRPEDNAAETDERRAMCI